MSEETRSANTRPNVRATEMMVAARARELHDNEVIIVGLGLPVVICKWQRWWQ